MADELTELFAARIEQLLGQGPHDAMTIESERQQAYAGGFRDGMAVGMRKAHEWVDQPEARMEARVRAELARMHALNAAVDADAGSRLN